MRLKGLSGKLLLALASFMVTLGAAELALRALGPAAPAGKGDGTLAQYMEHDAWLGWRKRPGARVIYRRSEYQVEVLINSHGLRDPERTYEHPPGVLRILALGDSFLEGYTVPLADTATQVLERQLNAAGARAEVINAGTAGYSTDQEYLYYSRQGMRYSPQIVLVFFYFNDVYFNARDSAWGDPKPVFVVNAGKLALAGVPVPTPQLAPAPTPGAVPPPERSGSALYAFVRDRLRRGAPRTYNRLAALGLWEAIQPLAPHPQLKVFKKVHVPAEIEDAWDRTARILAAWKQETETHQSRLLIVYVPSRMEVSDRDWELSRLRYSMDEPRWGRDQVAARLRRIGTALAVPVLDLTPALRAASGWKGVPYFQFDGHWNALGHRVAAEQIGAYLRRAGWLSVPRATTDFRASGRRALAG